jgi:precorrin-2 dehydrogenase / sirohydrochlorin ferrochelatase
MEQVSSTGYPVVLRLAGKRCVVFGTGHEAEQKAAGLRAAGAEVVQSAHYDPALIEGAFLVVAAGPDRSENPRIFADCEARGILVNCLDDPPRCRFTYPSVHRQGDLLIAVSTSGACPALAVRLRERFEREFGKEYEWFLEMCRGLRGRLSTLYPDFGARKAAWYRIVDSPALVLWKEGRAAEAEAAVESAIEGAGGDQRRDGGASG